MGEEERARFEFLLEDMKGLRRGIADGHLLADFCVSKTEMSAFNTGKLEDIDERLCGIDTRGHRIDGDEGAK